MEHRRPPAGSGITRGGPLPAGRANFTIPPGDCRGRGVLRLGPVSASGDPSPHRATFVTLEAGVRLEAGSRSGSCLVNDLPQRDSCGADRSTLGDYSGGLGTSSAGESNPTTIVERALDRL